MHTQSDHKIAVIGMGAFGALTAQHLTKYYEIVPITRTSDRSCIRDCSIVIFAVPFSSLQSAIDECRPYIAPDALLVDVTSVKERPLQLLQEHFPHHHILGTHPIFGPESSKNGLVGLPIVLCNVSFSPAQYRATKKFLEETFHLNVIEQTPSEHDQDMAEVQALTHLIGRTLKEINVKSHATDTASYRHLLHLNDLIKNDSWELFTTIQNSNPYAQKRRREFLEKINELEHRLNE